MSSRHERSQFHRTHMEPFKAWLDGEHVEYREGKGEWQALQVKHPVHGWCVIHNNARPEHLTIDSRLGSMVARFLRFRREQSRILDEVAAIGQEIQNEDAA